MSKLPKNSKRAVLITCVCLAVLFISQLFGFANTKTAWRIGYFANEGRYHWSAKYHMLDGEMAKTIHAMTEPDILHIEVETISGELSVTVQDKQGNVLSEEKSIPTSAYDVEIPGDVRVTVRADNHKGRLYIHTKELNV